MFDWKFEYFLQELVFRHRKGVKLKIRSHLAYQIDYAFSWEIVKEKFDVVRKKKNNEIDKEREVITTLKEELSNLRLQNEKQKVHFLDWLHPLIDNTKISSIN